MSLPRACPGRQALPRILIVYETAEPTEHLNVNLGAPCSLAVMDARSKDPMPSALGEGVDWSDGSETRVHSILRAARDRSSASDELAVAIEDWPTKYHFSRLRPKILGPLRIERGMRVLDLGGGTGPVSRKLGELGAEVLLLDGSAERARCAAVRCEDLRNVSVAVGTTFDLDDASEGFDVVLVVGVLEYAQSSAGGAEALLRGAVSLLAPAGVLAVAIENAIGLKYLIGYAEDHVWLPWVGLEGYSGIDGVRTYSRVELVSLLTASGLPEQAWFYPFPDYKLPTVIVSEPAYEFGADLIDAIVPRPCSPDASPPTLVCDPRAAHRTLLRAGLGPDIANSFLVVAARNREALESHIDSESLAWLPGAERRARFMRDRRLTSQDGELVIVDDTADHRGEDDWLTQKRFSRTPFVSGIPLDRLVMEALAASDAERASELLRLWKQTLRQAATVATTRSSFDTSPFHAAEGRLALPGNYLDSSLSNFVFADGRLHRIDAEWEARGLIDFGLACIRGLLWFAVEAIASGLPAPASDVDDVAGRIRALASSAGLDDVDVGDALRRLVDAEAELEAMVYARSADHLRTQLNELLGYEARDLTFLAHAMPLTAVRREFERLKVENELMRAQLQGSRSWRLRQALSRPVGAVRRKARRLGSD